MGSIDKIYKEIERELKSSSSSLKKENVGVVREIKDEVVLIEGLDNVAYNEIVEFPNNLQGLVVDLKEEGVGVLVLGNYLNIKENDLVKATGKIFSLAVSDQLLGRVINALGEPIDGRGKIKSEQFYPVERIAPGVIYRKKVNLPLQTGIKAIDALLPIGRGQRELIIGDRGTGKTTLALDTIINQKKENVICIYCAIGQKNSKIANTVELLKKYQALDYTIVLAASASESVSMQYLSPYAATAIAEYFMDQGKDVLVIYDDLTKHAWAYRQIALILRRPAGREAYPGDIFYLHSKLLERACQRDPKYGGGSITALPIIETLEGDVSSYIPTNVISITDGQIFLETDLFNTGIRPAINIGLSVSRVGGDAQTKIMKQTAGKLKLDLAQYREVAAFSQFESDLDETTKQFLNRGAKTTQILRQKKNYPYNLAWEIAIIYAATNGYLDNLPLEKIESFEDKLIADLQIRGKKWVEEINRTKVFSKETEEQLKKYIQENLNSLNS
jgi:F-type H+-transporting ATPase subunit alpha